jgi:lysophospholipase L1-like esterase
MKKTKVVLLGDSIRLIGYGTKVPTLLGDEYEVFQPTDNCRFSKYLLHTLIDYKKEIDEADIIHFNSGEWDVSREFSSDGKPFTELEEYINNITRIVNHLKSKNKKLIFATTTPVLPHHFANSNEDIIRYNEAIVPIVSEMGVEINDLYTLINEAPSEYIRDDDAIHLTDKGIDVAARQVVKAIKATK